MFRPQESTPLHAFLLTPTAAWALPQTALTPSARLAEMLLAPGDAATIALLATLLPGLDSPANADGLLERIGSAFHPTTVEPQGAIGLVATLLVHRLATLEGGRLHLTAAGRAFAMGGEVLVRITDALAETGGLVTPERLWRALAADAPVATVEGSRSALRRLLARGLDDAGRPEPVGGLAARGARPVVRPSRRRRPLRRRDGRAL